jgi:hypothetical protein
MVDARMPARVGRVRFGGVAILARRMGRVGVSPFF